MTRRFAPEQLYVLRNDIPIDRLIEQHLSIPWRRSDKRFRFACPLCAEFKTSILTEKNLARCFQCEQNFNTIDLVIHCMGVEFVKAVKKLQKIHAQMSQFRRNASPAGRIDSLASVGKIIADIIPGKPVIEHETKTSFSNDRELLARIDRLESKIDDISARIEKLRHTPPSI
jgi:DNA primase